MGIKRNSVTGKLLLGPDGKVKRCSCCGSCECAGEPCETLPMEEFHIPWTGSTVTELFRREAACCCDNDTVYRIYQQTMYGASADGTSYCLQVEDGAGPRPTPVHFRLWYNGTLALDYTYLNTYGHCDAYGPNVGYEGCRNFFQVGLGNGEWHRTCTEDWGWWSYTYPEGTRAVHTWYTAAFPDPSDFCLTGCGACCLPDGAGCIQTSPQGCAALGGEFYPATKCRDAPCHPDELGACCSGFPSYVCTQQLQSDCESDGGIFLGPGVPCDPDPCPPPPTGACCRPGLPCEDGHTYATCLAIGGTFQGANSTCAGANCDPDLGACCYPNGFCDLETISECAENGGIWAGSATTCNQSTCPTGACCKPDGSCVVVTSLGCSQLFGYYWGDGTTCDDLSCLGCCCKDGLPLGNMSLADCVAAGGIWHGPNLVCLEPGGEDVPPPPGVIDCSSIIEGGGDAPMMMRSPAPRSGERISKAGGCGGCRRRKSA